MAENKRLLEKIDKLKARVKEHEVIQSMFKEWDLPLDLIDYIPIAFSELNVSAKTERGIIYLNYLLADDGLNDDDHYLVHEITHWLQQCFSKDGIPSSDGPDYLENEYEQEAFQNQTEYMADTQGEETAEDYVEQVLDHHKVNDKKERKQRKEELLAIARRII